MIFGGVVFHFGKACVQGGGGVWQWHVEDWTASSASTGTVVRLVGAQRCCI